jgi:uncharacterized membrane protein YgcG
MVLPAFSRSLLLSLLTIGLGSAVVGCGGSSATDDGGDGSAGAGASDAGGAAGTGGTAGTAGKAGGAGKAGASQAGHAGSGASAGQAGGAGQGGGGVSGISGQGGASGGAAGAAAGASGTAGVGGAGGGGAGASGGAQGGAGQSQGGAGNGQSGAGNGQGGAAQGGAGGSVAQGGASGDAGAAGTSGGAGDGGAGGAAVVCGAGQTACGAECVDESSDTAHCGACDGVCASGAQCLKGVCSCPTYQKACGGKCIQVVTDPANCGGCGVTCQGGEVCSAGACSATCLPGQTACDGTCVDLPTDSNNCGACGKACGAGQGCVFGACVKSHGATTGKACDGGGSPLLTPIGGKDTCLGALAQKTFSWALCSCTDIKNTSTLTTDAYDSTQGPYVAPGGPGAGIGLNHDFSVYNALDISGSIWTSGALSNTTTIKVGQQLHVGQTLASYNLLDVTLDAYVGGDITATAPVNISGTLHQPKGAKKSDQVNYTTFVYEPVAVPPPCDCSAEQLIPVAAIVASHKTLNDNDTLSIDADLLVTNNVTRLDLPCGSFYFTGIANTQPMAIYVHGRTAIYIDGDVNAYNQLSFNLDPTAELDLFISGALHPTSSLAIGSPNYPALSRTYTGSPATTFNNEVTIGGFLYTAPGTLSITSPLTIYGGIFTGEADLYNALSIHYDGAVLAAGDSCAQPSKGGTGGSGGSGGSAGAGGSSAGGASGGAAGAGGQVVPPPECTTCKDCGNQACNSGTCGACKTNADCCAPLFCNPEIGKCVISYKP